MMSLPPAPVGDSPVDNLRRIHRDAVIRRHVEASVDEMIAQSGSPLAVALVDMDSSAELRGRSLAIKLAAVDAMRERAEHLLPEDGRVHSLGTRDEFVVTIPLTGPDIEVAAMRTLDAVRQGIAAKPLALPDMTVTATFSAGVSIWPIDATDAYDLLLLADGACRTAKLNGRDRCERSESGFRHMLETEVSEARWTGLVALAASTGQPVDVLLRRAIDLVLERHSGLERFCVAAEQLP